MLAQSANADDWSMFMHDAMHTSVSEEILEPPLEILWKFKTDDAIYSSPAVSNGVVYIGSEDSYIYALEGSNGSLIWKYETDGAIYSSPAVYEGKVYIISADGYMYALDTSTGSLKWKFELFTPSSNFKRMLPLWKWKSLATIKYLSSPTVSDGIIYVYFGSSVYALDARSGNLKWKYDDSTFLSKISKSSPAVSKGFVYLGGLPYKHVIALDANTGGLKWIYETNDLVYSSPSVSGNVLYIGSWDTFVYALDANTGNLIWKSNTSDSILSSPAVSGGKVYISPAFGYVYSLDASTGSLKWIYKTDFASEKSFSYPAISGGIVYMCSGDEYIYALDANTSSLKWKYKIGHTIGPAISNGIIYIGSDDGNLYAFSPLQNISLSVSEHSISEPLWTDTIPWKVIIIGVFCIVFIISFFLLKRIAPNKEERMTKHEQTFDKIYGITEKGFIGKAKGFFFKPSEAFETVRDEPLHESIKFFIRILVFILAISALFSVVSAFIYGPIGNLSFSLKPGIFAGILGFIWLFLNYGSIFYWLIFTYVISSAILQIIIFPITHIMVYILGGRKGITQTLKAVIYASSIYLLLGWLPIIYLPWIWALVVEIVGIRKLHALSTGRAIMSSIIPLIFGGIFLINVIMKINIWTSIIITILFIYLLPYLLKKFELSFYQRIKELIEQSEKELKKMVITIGIRGVFLAAIVFVLLFTPLIYVSLLISYVNILIYPYYSYKYGKRWPQLSWIIGICLTLPWFVLTYIMLGSYSTSEGLIYFQIFLITGTVYLIFSCIGAYIGSRSTRKKELKL